MKIRIGSRESRLAVIQSRLVMDRIAQAEPQAELELVTMKTTGDKILDKTLDKIGGKGLFVRELDQALRDGRADFTVHSLKDMPMEVPEDLPLAAFSKREDPRDVLVLPEGIRELDKTKPIGCSSRRRQSWPFLAQQKYSIRRLTTAQASIVPRPAPKTPCFGIRSVLKITSSTHMTAFKMLGVSISPAH